MFRELMQAIEYTVKTKIPKLRQVDLHGGGFSGIDDVKNFATYAPAVKIGVSEITDEVNNEGGLFCILSLSMLLVTKDSGTPNSRYLIGLDYLEELKLLVKEGVWKNKDDQYLKGVFKPEKDSIKSKSFFGPQLFSVGVAMWVLSWQQKVIIGNSVFDDKGELPTTYDVTADIKAPKKDKFELTLAEKEKRYL